MRKILLLPILFILCISFVYAVNFETQVTDIKQTIDVDGPAKFGVTIKSNSTEQEEYVIYSPEVEWNIAKKTLIVQAGFEITEEITVSPTKYTTVGPAGVHLNVRQESTGDLIEHLVLITVISSEEDDGYKPSVKMSIDILRQINPREPLTIKINLENQNPLDLPNLSLIVSSDLISLNRESTVDLGSVKSENDKKVTLS